MEADIEVLALTGLDETTDRASAQGIKAARHLGIERIDLYDAQGRLVSAHAFSPDLPTAPEQLDPNILSQAKNGQSSYTTIAIEHGTYRPRSISPWNVINGGTFGEEHILPLSSLDPNKEGAVRVIATYSGLSHKVATIIARTVIAALVVVGTILIGLWLLLRYFVAQPLQRYSELAMRIAIGERVRMPANGRDELSTLARAVNGMADALEHQATVDALTGLYNLRHLSSQLEDLLVQATTASQPLSLIFCDLDDLKQVNDTYGHEAGDAVLRAVAASIRVWSGATFTCWRLGGDEFVIAMPNVDAAEAVVRGEKLRKAVASTLVPISDTQIRTSVSIGIASYPDDGDSPALLGIADRRMYESKTSLLPDERRLAATTAA